MSTKKDITLSEIKQVATSAISHFNVNKYLNSFTEDELISLCKNADPDLFTDISVADNDIVQENFRWDKVRPKRLARMMARAIDLGYASLLFHIDTKVMKLHVKDLRHLLRRSPESIERFNIDLSKISNVEAIILLELGKTYFLDKIDIKGRKFSLIQQYDICNAYDFDRAALSLFDCKRFDGFQTKEIMKRTGDKSVDLLNPRSLKLVDWLDLLSEKPDMYRYCNLDDFKNEPISQLISLAVKANNDEVYSLIRKKNLDEVSPFGWEKLMSHRPEMFKDVCDYKKFDALNKKNVLASHPHLAVLIQARKGQST